MERGIYIETTFEKRRVKKMPPKADVRDMPLVTLHLCSSDNFDISALLSHQYQQHFVSHTALHATHSLPVPT